MPVLMLRSWVLNEIWITHLSSTLVGMSMSSSKLFLFSKGVHLKSGVRQLLELHRVVLIQHVAFFTICLPLNLYTSVFGCGCGIGFEQKIWRINGFGEKKSADQRICIPLFIPVQECDSKTIYNS